MCSVKRKLELTTRHIWQWTGCLAFRTTEKRCESSVYRLCSYQFWQYRYLHLLIVRDTGHHADFLYEVVRQALRLLVASKSAATIFGVNETFSCDIMVIGKLPSKIVLLSPSKFGRDHSTAASCWMSGRWIMSNLQSNSAGRLCVSFPVASAKVGIRRSASSSVRVVQRVLSKWRHRSDTDQLPARNSLCDMAMFSSSDL